MHQLIRFPFHLKLALAATLVQGCSAMSGKTPEIYPERPGMAVPVKPAVKSPKTAVVTGPASWYGPGFNGKKTASGEIFDDGKMTAAHKTMPLGTKAKVTNLSNGKTVHVEINDRGPYVEGRILDLSQAAAQALGMIERGVAQVRIEPLDESEVAAIETRK